MISSDSANYLRGIKLNFLAAGLYVLPILVSFGLILAYPSKTIEAADFLSRGVSIFLVLYVLLAPFLVFALVFVALKCLLGKGKLFRLMASSGILFVYSIVFFWFLGLLGIREATRSYSIMSEISPHQGLEFGLAMSGIAFLYVVIAPVLVGSLGVWVRRVWVN